MKTVGSILCVTLSLILIVGYSKLAYKSSEKPQYKIGECYCYKEYWFEIEVIGFYGVKVKVIHPRGEGYLTLDGLYDSKRVDCDLVKKVYE